MTNTACLGVPAFSNPAVYAAMTTRDGGVSVSPWLSWNLGDHVGDEATHVAANRCLLQERLAALAAPPAGNVASTGQNGGNAVAGLRMAWARQVHGASVAVVGAQPDSVKPEADALLTCEQGVACCILVADCLPVLFAHRHLPLVAAAHAGWRGLCGQSGLGVVESTLAALADQAGQSLVSMARDLEVWLGPCIGPAAFEVGSEVHDAFERGYRGDGQCFTAGRTHGKWWADLAALARLRLSRAGVTHVDGNDSTPPWCTAGNPQRYFSHRAEASVLGSTGRMAACIGIKQSWAC